MNTILGLDIGTDTVKAILGQPTKKGVLKILGVGRCHQKDGSMHAGAIADIPAVVAACEEALVEVEKQAGERASLTVVGVAGELVKGNTTTVRYSRKNPNKPITEAEMEDIISKVQEKSAAVARKSVALETGNKNVEVRLINSAIVSLMIDGYKISNPIGFKGSDVVIQFYTAFAPMIHIAAIEKVCAELNLDLLTVAVEPFAVCRACLGNDLESNFAGIMIDIGGGTTDIAVVEDGGVEGTKMFSIGGRSFTHQVAEGLGVDFATAEDYKLNLDTGELDDYVKAKAEASLTRSLSVWLAGVEVALEDFEAVSSLPRNILLCGGGAGLAMLQETLALKNWYADLPFSRRPTIHLLDVDDLPDLDPNGHELDHAFATAVGLLRVGVDTLESAPEEHHLRDKISRLLQN